MRALILLSFLFSFSIVLSQKWQAAEWVNTAGERDSGFVKMPTRKWQKLASIQLKPATKKWYKKASRGKDLVFLHTLEGDTLLNTVFFDEKNLWLQTILKGEFTLLREVASKNNHFLSHKGHLIQLSRFEVEEQLYNLLKEDCTSFDKENYFYNTPGLIRVVRTLNKCIYKEEPKWLSLKWSKYKWRYTLGYFSSDYHELKVSYDLKGAKKHHFQMGVEHHFLAFLPHFSLLLQTSYTGFTKKDHYINVYEREIKRSFLKLSSALRFEFFPRRSITPFISGGVILAATLKSQWTFNLLPGKGGGNGYPIWKKINTKLPPKMGLSYSAGFRINLSKQTRLSLIMRDESFPIFNSKRYDSSEKIQFIGFAHKKIPFEFMVGITLSRAISKRF